MINFYNVFTNVRLLRILKKKKNTLIPTLSDAPEMFHFVPS